jgi:hypothetical protein
MKFIERMIPFFLIASIIGCICSIKKTVAIKESAQDQPKDAIFINMVFSESPTMVDIIVNPRVKCDRA